jgi:hypothetical protein
MAVEVGWGIIKPLPIVVASKSLLTQSAALNPFISTTSPNDGVKHQYLIGGYIDMTAFTNGSANWRATWTESAVLAHSILAGGQNGGFITGVVGVSVNNFWPIPLLVDPNTVVQLEFQLAGVNTSNISGFIMQVS